jgi:hypothetical protein
LALGTLYAGAGQLSDVSGIAPPKDKDQKRCTLSQAPLVSVIQAEGISVI